MKQYNKMQYNMYIHAYTHRYIHTTHTYIYIVTCHTYNTCNTIQYVCHTYTFTHAIQTMHIYNNAIKTKRYNAI